MNKLNFLNDYQVEIANENHTFMNILKTVLANNWHAKNTDLIVEFCGYTIPHPSEPSALINIQFTKNDEQSEQNIKLALVSACDCIENICDSMLLHLK
ncbi:hypothetical protein EHP00_327 [Ecytonucleospora hepatopenaei]|uniref:DNA-directed RNA polymerase RBP11-like dimerisation domain-containing protein n=1 Tax=Ecytonucleospora hepatopenaei TaxID=646526 RepID=A0A1W0E7E5_9MICR|nr:hypothetical protein EHP00_327 [Ecytonucleospora hepatopenaei]